MANLRDLEVKVMGHILIDLVAKHKSGELRCPATALILWVSPFFAPPTDWPISYELK